MTASGSPCIARRPAFSRMASSQIAWMAALSCDTISSVVPCSRNARMRSKLLCWKYASPTDRASSTISTSGRTAVATLKASRICMPLEYTRTGWSM